MKPAPERDKQIPAAGGGLWLFGRHPVMAALANRERQKHRLLVSRKNADQYREELAELLDGVPSPHPELVGAEEFEKLLPEGSLHQGIALKCSPLPGRHLDEACAIVEEAKNLILVLDQVTDPHNVGAIIRSAAAFGAKAIVTPDRNAPPESGTLAKSASGCLELIPWVRVTNLSRALDQLAEMGYWRLGLDGYAEQTVAEADFGNNIVLVLGAEGKGLRKGTRDHCDALVKLPISERVESLNVSNAAAVALYEFSRD
ncbi:23S rRNA (guanosine(2251)-2'-O)-methyltransferase RlmB [Emcibacter nanhaiensis]|uniref:23S rRNA (Guanosine(2251)-2'-O)-methyltransferase RlmB n=2 Tax=Emcibacter nanhaiensis TaxID=1505037 RepID=A0A501PDA8_9PROT|nr:23S rRNA (guanosine(2251)-2'-O)-methyltransferase RlmB [Emcibacter nanhaiensis]